MKKRILFICLILILGLSGFGCQSVNKALREKFIRKKKGEDETKQVIITEEEEAYPNKVKYEMHYIYWDAWMTELTNQLGENKKRDVANCRRAFENLKKMSSLLKEEKACKLEPYIEKLSHASKDIASGGANSEVNSRMLKRSLKKIWKAVKREFAPYKLDEEWIKPDFY